MIPERPFILVNMAMSADGKIASANRGVNHFSSVQDEAQLYRLRASVDAVLNGADTVNAGPVKMDPGPEKYRRQRLRQGLAEYNLRIIATGSGSLSPEAEVFRHTFSKIIILTTRHCPKKRADEWKKQGAEVFVSPYSELNFQNAFQQLRRKFDVKRLLCEGGGRLNSALFQADLVDEVHLTVCPLLIGGRESPTIADGTGFSQLRDAARFELVKRRAIGHELFLTYRRKP